MMVDGVLIGEHALRQALAHDDHRLALIAIASVKIASGDQGDAQRGEEAGRDGAELRARIFFARRADMAVGGELERRDRCFPRRATERRCPRRRGPRPGSAVMRRMVSL